MEHPVDEYSASDFRHTLGEIWRVLGERRWHLILGFLGASTLTLVGSLWIPRLYTASVIMAREQDPVLASMMGRAGTESYGELRKRLAVDLADRERIHRVVRELNLPRTVGDEDDAYAAARAGRSALIEEIAAGLAMKTIESTENRDVVSISLTLPNPGALPEILRSVRDQYVEATRHRILDALRGVMSFFRTESDRCRGKLAEAQRNLSRMDSEHPGIDPDAPNPVKAEQGALAVERVQLERQIDEARVQRQGLEEQRGRACARLDAGVSSPAQADAQVENPRYSGIRDEIEKIGAEIDENRTLRSMTTQHPTNQRLLTMLALKYSELERTPQTIAAGAVDVRTAGPRDSILAAMEQLEVREMEEDARIVALGARLDQVDARYSQLSAAYAGALEHREEYLRQKELVGRAQAELRTWQGNLGPIEQILKLENSDRALHFTTLKEVESSLRPSSPDVRATLGICFGIGAAVAVLIVVIAEVTDRSFRTARTLARTLGIPVIESIDEIVTSAIRRRRLLRRLVLMPTITAMLFAVTGFAGAMAYLSLARPRDYDTVRHSPTRIYDVCFSASEEP